MRIVPRPSPGIGDSSIKFYLSTREQIDAVVLSHSHLDHAGKLPSLCKTYDGPIHCTSATKDLCGIMLLDSAHIQEQDAIFVSKVRARKHQPPVEPLYTTPDAQKCVQQLVAHDYEKSFQPVSGVTVTFRDAGHILGSAQVILDISGKRRKIPLAVHRRHRARRR